jgi:hypothetical protein
MSALHREADIGSRGWHVRSVDNGNKLIIL